MNGLLTLEQRAEPDDWVLVHDAVRPCVRTSDIERLIDLLSDHPTGGLLGLPVRDTMKRCGVNEEVMETLNREGLWHAQTPQMFRLEPLRRAIEHSLRNDVFVTDEAQAMELTGCTPRIVEGHADNIKITRRVDMSLADIFLAHQESGG
jgi:2-C-methyl-D-erythritol 4-phosphate cytidylyltransferase